MPLCVCYQCRCTIDCDPSGICEVCETYTMTKVTTKLTPNIPSPQMAINILQRLHQTVLKEDTPYVRYTSHCRWQYKQGVYWCEHVRIKEEDVADVYKRQMEK